MQLKEFGAFLFMEKIKTLFEISGSALKLADAIASGYLRIEIRQAPNDAV
jgi:hypothetical protein